MYTLTILLWIDIIIFGFNSGFIDKTKTFNQSNYIYKKSIATSYLSDSAHFLKSFVFKRLKYTDIFYL